MFEGVLKLLKVIVKHLGFSVPGRTQKIAGLWFARNGGEYPG